jgi:hypothetical protein
MPGFSALYDSYQRLNDTIAFNEEQDRIIERAYIKRDEMRKEIYQKELPKH